MELQNEWGVHLPFLLSAPGPGASLESLRPSGPFADPDLAFQPNPVIL